MTIRRYLRSDYSDNHSEISAIGIPIDKLTVFVIVFVTTRLILMVIL